MDILTLTYDQLPHGGFAGLVERRFVMDERVLGGQSMPLVFNGLGGFVYLADANFLPFGETTMHGHHQLDVIYVMVEGNITHAGSMAHGEHISAGQVQVQRAGVEGFRHNEINPDDQQNQMIQLWVLPDDANQSAGYKVYTPALGEMTKIYGGDTKQQQTFDSKTTLYVANARAGQQFSVSGPAMAYICKGEGIINGQNLVSRTLVRHANSHAEGLSFTATCDSMVIFVALS